MLDQLRIGNQYSYDDYQASVMKRSIEAPKKKSVKETIPYSNMTYDFSSINGETYWEERQLSYVLEIVADTPEELENLKIEFQNWVMNVMNEELYDPFITGHHFVATFSDISFEDEEDIEKTTVTVTFTAYPYQISNEKKHYTINVTSESATINVENPSAHRITPTLISDVPVTIRISGNEFSMAAGTISSEKFMLERGINEITVTASETNGIFTIEFAEEVF